MRVEKVKPNPLNLLVNTDVGRQIQMLTKSVGVFFVA